MIFHDNFHKHPNKVSQYNKYPTPKDALKDSINSFYVDHGTYSPAKSKTEKYDLLIYPTVCAKTIKLVIGYSFIILNIWGIIFKTNIF